MDKKRYSDLVNRHMPKENKIYNTMKSFIVGGTVGVIGQLLIDIYKNWFNIPTK
jgi:hypothetical protein